MQEISEQPSSHIEAQDQFFITNTTKPQHEYVSERVFRNKAFLCRIPYPFVEGDNLIEETLKEEPKRSIDRKITVAHKVQFKPNLKKKTRLNYDDFLNYEKTPINEYLNYELSEEINYGIRDVKSLASEIKAIKEDKKMQKQHKDSKKLNKRIRVRKTNFNGGLYRTGAFPFKSLDCLRS